MSSVISAIKNNIAEVVLVSPDEYNDYLLLTMAVKRMENYVPSNIITETEMRRRLNITQEDLDGIGEVEFE